ncbi:MAG: hypothetical protein EXQ84_07365 [Rhodospirillaceae bacterium]|nr:hypothetical protein [Rhodospirillaceae bacterium]
MDGFDQMSVGQVFSLAIRDVRGVVARALSSARGAGHDYVGQTRAAAAAVVAVRPDLSFVQALDAVSRLRDRGEP